MTIRQVAEIELHAGAKEPVERHLVDGHHRLSIHRMRMIVDWCVHMGSVMGLGCAKTRWKSFDRRRFGRIGSLPVVKTKRRAIMPSSPPAVVGHRRYS